MPFLKILFVLITLWAANVSAAFATELARIDADYSELILHSDVTAIEPDETFTLAIEIVPREGWHTYWRNSGDSGAPPIFEWQLNAGAAAAGPQYPTPHRIPYGPLMNYGYKGAVTFLVKASTGRSGGYRGTLEAEWLVCDVECIPQVATLSFSVPAGEGQLDPAARDLFAAARASQPEPAYWGSMLTVSAMQSDLLVYMAAEEAEGLTDAYFFSAHPGVAAYPAKQSWSLGEKGLTLSVERENGAPDVAGADGVLMLRGADGQESAYALTPMLKVAAAVAPLPVQSAPPLPLWQAGFFALIGGLILNLMPCVFPILSLKAFAFVSANYKSAANRKKEGWAYTLGIWVSFMAIVGVLLVLRASGEAIGWGFQLQEPVFVGLMVLLMVLVALSLSGMFDLGFGGMDAGHNLASREGARGAFFKGVLATLVATPCTAPLMAPAIGYALTQPTPVVLVVFSLLALGLALPFLLLSYSPAVARLMPRPGAWMERVKQGLAFPMYLTAAWLLYVFDRGVGAVGTFVLVAAVIGVVFAIWLSQQGAGRVLRGMAVAIGLLAVTPVLMEVWVEPEIDTSGFVEPIDFSDQALAENAGGDRPLFVYFTADWCITCKVNERLVLLTDATQTIFKNNGIAVMKGDWTSRDDEIAAVLTRYGRAGVPLYLYFPAGSREALVLPEVLTTGIITDLIDND